MELPGVLQETVLAPFLGHNHLSTGLDSWESVGHFPLHGVHSSCSLLSSRFAETFSKSAAHPSTPGSRMSSRPFLQPEIVFSDTLLAGLAYDSQLVSHVS